MPLSIPLGPFQIFLEIRRDIRSSRCNSGVIDTGGKWKKSSIKKVYIILFGQPWEVELTYRYIFAFKFTLRSQQPGIVPIICHQCHWHRWQICHGCRRWQIATHVDDIGGKFAAGVVDTGSNFVTGIVDTDGKFATGGVDNSGAPWLANISANFWKNLKRSLWDTLGMGGNWFMKNTRSK